MSVLPDYIEQSRLPVQGYARNGSTLHVLHPQVTRHTYFQYLFQFPCRRLAESQCSH